MSFEAYLAANLHWLWDSGAEDNSRLTHSRRIAEGTGDNQANAVWHVESRALVNGTPDTWDLTALTRTVLGETHTTSFSRIKAILIRNLGDHRILVGAADVNEWWEPFGRAGDTIMVPRMSPLMLANLELGWEVETDTSSSSSSSGENSTDINLKLAAQGGNTTYSIAIIGLLSSSASSSSSSSGA